MKDIPLKSKKKVYIFPLTSNKLHTNSYIINLAKSLAQHYTVSNIDRKRSIGIFDIGQYLDADIYIFNWPENIHKYKFGLLQTVTFMFMGFFLRIFKKRIVWILHNKHPHIGETFWANVLMSFTAFISTNVITHSREGVGYYKKKYNKNNAIFIPHPLYPEAQLINRESVYDIIIWGKISPYKNVAEFLSYLKCSSTMSTMKVLICGECSDEIYCHKMQENLTAGVTFINKHVPISELNQYISSSKVILFTYNSSSILSSGALVYSLPFKKRIIGPNLGAFTDYKDLNLIYTYNSFDEIPDLLDLPPADEKAMNKYLAENTWEGFSLTFDKMVRGEMVRT